MATVGSVCPDILSESRIVSVSLDVLLQILRPLEGLAAEVAPMRLQRYMNADMRRDVVALHNCDATGTPGTSEVKIIGTFTTDVALANVFLSSQDQLKHLGQLGVRSLT